MALRIREKTSLSEMIGNTRGKKENRAALSDIENRQNIVKGNIEEAKSLSTKKPSKPRQKPSFKGLNQLIQPDHDQISFDKIVSEPLDNHIVNIDQDDGGNCQLASEYVNEIYKYMRKIEKLHLVHPDFLGSGTGELQPKMRAILVDWLVGVHREFKLLQETLYLTVFIIDKYLSIPGVAEATERKSLQLVGVTGLLLASKFEEIYAPEITDFVYITDDTYTVDQIQAMERKVLTSLDFNIVRPLPLHFLRRGSKAAEADAGMHTLAKYIMELALLDYNMVAILPSVLAAASLLLSLKVHRPDVSLEALWTPTLVHYTSYAVEDLVVTVHELANILSTAKEAKLQTVRRKYSGANFMKIALLPNLTNAENIVMKE